MPSIERFTCDGRTHDYDDGLKKGLVASLTDEFLRSVTMDPSNYEVDEMNAHAVGSGKDRKVALNMTLIRLAQFAA